LKLKLILNYVHICQRAGSPVHAAVALCATDRSTVKSGEALTIDEWMDAV